MKIERLILGKLQTNCYLLSPEADAKDVLVIDPAAEGEKIREALRGRNVLAVLLTHGHFDHTGALGEFADKPIYMHRDDAVMLSDAHWSVGEKFGDFAPRPAATNFVDEGDEISFPCFPLLRVMHTPGHTLGGVTYCFGADYFTGDTLFKRAYGRVDHPGGDFHAEMESLRRLLKSPVDAAVYPGHGEATSLFAERGRS